MFDHGIESCEEFPHWATKATKGRLPAARNGAINDRIDEAYRTKYAGSPYLKPMIGGRARAATVRVMPRG